MVVVLRSASTEAHTISVDTFLAVLRSPTAREQLGVEEVERNPDLPRLLLIRVGPGWERAPAEKRRGIAEAWLRDWCDIVPQGIIAILDRESGKSLVSFDAEGHASLKAPK